MHPAENNLILIRGLPGSGKSTLAAVLSEHGKYPVYSVDQYFTDPATGDYHFEFDKNHLAYKSCADRTKEAMENRIEKIFVDNTFIFDWEVEPYLQLAAQYGYRIFVLTAEKYHSNPNIHGVSEEQIIKMAARYKVRLFN